MERVNEMKANYGAPIRDPTSHLNEFFGSSPEKSVSANSSGKKNHKSTPGSSNKTWSPGFHVD